MLSFDKSNYVLRKLFDASAMNGLVVPDGLNRAERVQFALSSGIFSEGELTWLRAPDPELADERGNELFRSQSVGRVRVGFVQSALARVGGIETWLRTLVNRLDSVDVIGAVASAPYCEVYKGGLSIPVGVGAKAAAGLADRVDVLIVSNEFRLSRIFKMTNRRPKVIMVHHGDETCEHSARVVQSQAQFADCLVTVNPRAAIAMRSLVSRVVHIRNAPDPLRSVPSVSRNAMREAVGIPIGAKVVLYSGRFSPEKGYALARAIGERLPDGMFMVLMGGGLDDYHSKLRYVGQQSLPGDWYGAADIAISPSEKEGAGIGMMELALARVPIVATRRGIIDEHPAMAHVMPEGSTADDWVQAIVSDLADPMLQRVRAQVAERIVQTHYSVDEFASRWQSLILEIAQ